MVKWNKSAQKILIDERVMPNETILVEEWKVQRKMWRKLKRRNCPVGDFNVPTPNATVVKEAIQAKRLI